MSSGARQGQFAAVVTSSADMALSTLGLEEIEGRDLRNTLTAFGQHLMNIWMSPTLIGAYRIAAPRPIASMSKDTAEPRPSSLRCLNERRSAGTPNG